MIIVCKQDQKQSLARMADLLSAHLKPIETGDRPAGRSVAWPAIEIVSRALRLHPRAIMEGCLQLGIWPECLRANLGAIEAGEQARLLQSSVAVIGAGGLGGAVIQGLARMGLGCLHICDGDAFDESNLNRQLLCRRDCLGINKARAAEREVKSINPALQTRVFPVWATRENLPEILDGCQIAVDCLDNMPARHLLARAAAARGLPFVHGSLGGLEGFALTVFPDGPGLAQLYGPPDAESDEPAADPGLGAPYYTPAVIGAMQVKLVVDTLLGKEDKVRGRVLHFDLDDPRIEIYRFPPE